MTRAMRVCVGLVLSILGVSSTAGATPITLSTIDGTGPGVTPPGWDGATTISYWGPLNTVVTAEPTFGQSFTGPAAATVLQSVTFEINTNSAANNLGPSFGYQGYVYGWDGSAPTGAALFTSPVLTLTPSLAWQTITVNTGNTPVTAGQQYVAFLTTLGATPIDTVDARTSWGGMQLANQDPYAGGNWVWSRDNTHWQNNPASSGADTAFALAFSDTATDNTAVPEPASLLLFGTGVSAMGLRRLRRIGRR